MTTQEEIQLLANHAMDKVIQDQKYAMLKGEYIGTLKGILLWNIDPNLESRIRSILYKLETIE